MFNSSWQSVTLPGNFTDPNAIAGYVPFNIQAIGSDLYVTYAQLTAQGTGLPGGYVDVFDTNGNFVKRFATGGALYAPWGITLAPAGFGAFGNDLLVGNFGNGEILAYNPVTGAYLGTLDGTGGTPIVNDYLWALDFRTGGPNVNADALYFTAGINNQQDGLFGEITPIPEPGTLLITALGLSALGFLKRKGADRAVKQGENRRSSSAANLTRYLLRLAVKASELKISLRSNSSCPHRPAACAGARLPPDTAGSAPRSVPTLA